MLHLDRRWVCVCVTIKRNISGRHDWECNISPAAPCAQGLQLCKHQCQCRGVLPKEFIQLGTKMLCRTLGKKTQNIAPPIMWGRSMGSFKWCYKVGQLLLELVVTPSRVLMTLLVQPTNLQVSAQPEDMGSDVGFERKF